jgi:hypothetical protein
MGFVRHRQKTCSDQLLELIGSFGEMVDSPVHVVQLSLLRHIGQSVQLLLRGLEAVDRFARLYELRLYSQFDSAAGVEPSLGNGCHAERDRRKPRSRKLLEGLSALRPHKPSTISNSLRAAL